MDVNKVRTLASKVLKVGEGRIKITDSERAAEAITRDDVRQLCREKVIIVKPVKGISKARARKLRERKRKGRGMGRGKRKGAKKARANPKRSWMTKVRAQRRKLGALKGKMKASYRKTYKMVKAGFFKSIKHLESFVGEKE